MESEIHVVEIESEYIKVYIEVMHHWRHESLYKTNTKTKNQITKEGNNFPFLVQPDQGEKQFPPLTRKDTWSFLSQSHTNSSAKSRQTWHTL